MFAGFNREVRNTLRVAGLRLRYAVAVVEIAVEQYGATVAQNIDLLLTARGTGVVRTSGAVRVGSGRLQFQDANGYIERTTASNAISFAPSGASTSMSLTAAVLNVLPPYRGLAGSGAQSTYIFGATDRGGNPGVGHNVRVVAAAGSTATTGSSGGRLELFGGAANGTAANAGGAVLIAGGAPSSTGARGSVQLGYDGTNVCRVTVRNTILGLNGYTSTTAAPTTTEYPTAGDFGIHKNTTSGVCSLVFNDAGTIRTVAFT